MNRTGGGRLNTLLSHVILIVAGALFVFPFFMMVFNAFKHDADILSRAFWPKSFTIDNFTFVVSNTSVNLINSIKNSIIVTVTRTAILLYLATLWGYTLAKLRFRGRGFLMGLVLSVMMVPVSVILLPLFQEMIWFGLKGSLWSLIIVVNGTTSYAVFIMRQFIATLPDEILESGRIDGCNEFQIFHRLVFPLLRNAVSALLIIVFLYVWNDFLWSFMMIDDPLKYTVTVAMQFFNGRYMVQYGPLMAATSISLLPLLIVYFIFQNRFTQGIALSGIKE